MNQAALPPSRLYRRWALKPGVAFLNHGSFGACPKPILELQSELRREMEAEPVQFLWRRYEERLEPARRTVARFVGADPRGLVFIPNATTGVNAVLRSLRLRPGDELLTTNHDYNACHNAVVETARRWRAVVKVAEVPFPIRASDQVIEAVLKAVSRRTRLALIDHGTSTTGLIFPVATLVRELEGRGVDCLVDGAHAPGMVPVNLTRLAPAYYTANLHKWVCAPKGAAFLWVRPDRQKDIHPAVVSHGHNTPRPGYSSFQDRFDWAGTFDPTAWLCAAAAIDWMARLLPGGWRRLRQKNHRLTIQARQVICKALQVPAPCPQQMLGSMATIPLPEPYQNIPKSGRIDREQLRLYDEFRIEVPFYRFGRPERRYLRISAHIYNSLAEYEYLARAISVL
ncbi:MAG: aminotransferase [Verrucomicrobia bacterium]|nr:MAG: aminotransferase [Verrucomicrobiota bacterium]